MQSTNQQILDLVSIPSMPDGIDDQPWTGELHLQLAQDGACRASVVQLVTLTGQETVGAYASTAGTSWVSMTPSSTFACIADTDCTLYGLDTSNGPYSCVQSTCQRILQPPPCLPTQDQCP
jgi:hypothetical protein